MIFVSFESEFISLLILNKQKDNIDILSEFGFELQVGAIDGADNESNRSSSLAMGKFVFLSFESKGHLHIF